MRAGSLSKEPVYNTLRSRFICGYKNIYKEPFAGNSGVHPMESTAVSTTNGAGPHNVQLFLLSADGAVLHCLPGYWDPHDLQSELELALKLNDVWENRSIAKEQKMQLFKSMQMDHLRLHSKEMIARSRLQNFDAKHISANPSQCADCFLQMPSQNSYGANVASMAMMPSQEGLKTTDRIMHERLCKYPFVSYDDFDIVAFTNYGTHYYDKNEDSLGGTASARKPKMNLRRITTEAVGAPIDPEPAADWHRGYGRRTAKRKPALAPDPFKPFYELTGQRKYSEALEFASKLVQQRPNDPTGYEMRAIAAYELQLYDQAYNDATRAAWLGCRKATNADLRRQAKERMAPKVQGSLPAKGLASR